MARAKQATTKQVRHPALSGVMRPHRYKSGEVCLREIRRHQKSTDLLIPKTAFARFAREILWDFSPSSRIKKDALEALQEATEMMLVRLFHVTNSATIAVGKRQRIQKRDFTFAAIVLGLSKTVLFD